jgi:outer membrane lipoprotein-sorting protein
MKLADNIIKLIRNVRVLDINTSDEMDQRIVRDALKAQEKLKTKSAETQPNVWRIIMQSKMTRLAVAAMIIVAVLIGIDQFGNPSVAWADVVEQIQVFRPYQCTETVYGKDRKPFGKTLFRLNLSQRREERQDGQIFIVDMTQRPTRTLLLDTEKKIAHLTVYHNRGPSRDPDFLSMLAQMETQDTERLQVRKINGANAQGFRTVSEYNDITIWADVNTGMPVKLEIIHIGHERKIVFEDFAFDIVFDPKLFSTESPEGYETFEDLRKADSNKGQEYTIQSPDGPREFIPHSCTQTVYLGEEDVAHKRVSHKTRSLRREEDSDDGSIQIVDLSEKPVRILRMDPENSTASLKILYYLGPAKNPDMLAMLASMKRNDSQKLGIQEIGGISAEGFHSVDPHNEITIWADMETGLPVKMEIVHSKRNRTIVFTDFDFETELDESLFLTVPPKGYDLQTETTPEK